MIDGKKIRMLREKAGLIQVELGKKVFVSQSMIDYVERGVKKPSAELLKRIADCLSVTVDELFVQEPACPIA